MRARRKLALLGLVAVGALVLAGCTKVTGGGWLSSANVETAEKATFGFTFQCADPAEGAKGKTTYHDPAAGVKIKGTVSPTTNACVANPTPGQLILFGGTYTPQPKKAGDGGLFSVAVVDLGEPGPSAGDQFAITFLTGMHAGESNSGTIGGGNIQQHDG